MTRHNPTKLGRGGPLTDRLSGGLGGGKSRTRAKRWRYIGPLSAREDRKVLDIATSENLNSATLKPRGPKKDDL